VCFVLKQAKSQNIKSLLSISQREYRAGEEEQMSQRKARIRKQNFLFDSVRKNNVGVL